MISIKKTLKRVFEDNDPEGAVEAIINKYPDPAKAYAHWFLVRSQSRKNDEYRNPEFHGCIAKLFMKNFPMTPEEEEVLQRLLVEPLDKQHKIVTTNYIYTRFAEQHLPELQLMREPYYRFVMDKNYADAYLATQLKRNEKKISTGGSSEISLEQATQITRQCDDFLFANADRELESNADAQRLVAALLFVTGRRVIEIVKDTVFQEGANPFQCIVTGIAKKKDGDRHSSYLIPLLSPFHIIKESIDKVRAKLGNRDYTDLTPSRKHKKSIYGVNLVHGQVRDIYQNLTFRERTFKNLVYPHLELQSEWAKRVLCHGFAIANTSLYTTIKIT